jgi:hypothetical protein
MIETVSTSRATSAVAFLESMQSKIELLMKAGDASDYKVKPKGGSKIVKCPKKEKKFLAIAMKRRAEGMPWTQAAQGTPWNADTLRSLAIRRGLSIPLNQTRFNLEYQKKFNAIAKRVNAEALRLGNLGKALANHPEITENQYQEARARLNLPHIRKSRYDKTKSADNSRSRSLYGRQPKCHHGAIPKE